MAASSQFVLRKGVDDLAASRGMVVSDRWQAEASNKHKLNIGKQSMADSSNSE